jgi:hypothetical protein
MTLDFGVIRQLYLVKMYNLKINVILLRPRGIISTFEKVGQLIKFADFIIFKK